MGEQETGDRNSVCSNSTKQTFPPHLHRMKITVNCAKVENMLTLVVQ